MADVQIKYTSDMQKLLRDQDKQIQKHEKTINKLTETVRGAKKVGTASEQSATQMSKAFTKGISGAKGLITQFAGIQAILGVVSSGYGDWIAHVDKLVEKHETLSRAIVKSLTEAGDLMSGARIEEFINAVPGATREQARIAFDTVTAGAPSLELNRRLAIARQVAPQAVTQVDVAELGLVAGQLAKNLPAKTADDIADIATNLRAQAGSEIKRVGGASFLRAVQVLQKTGLSFEQAAGFGLTALKADLRPDILTSVAAKLPRIEGGTAAEKLDRLLKEPALAREILGEDIGTRFGLIDASKAKARAEQIRQAQGADFAQKQIELLTGFASGREILTEQKQQVFADRAERLLELQESQAARALKEVRARTADEGPLSRFRASFEAGFQRRFGTARRRDFAPGVSDLQGAAGSVISSAVSMGALTREEAASFERREAEMTKQIMLLKQATDNLNRSSMTNRAQPARQATSMATE